MSLARSGRTIAPSGSTLDWVFDEIISPVLAARGDFQVVRADKVTAPGLIDAQIISQLLTAELVVADLTGLNPNAFYEIGIRHVVQKPIIHMHLAGQTIPFDISLFRSLKFSVRRPVDIRGARSDLAEMVEGVLADDYEVENPVTNARGRIRFDETATAPDRVLLEELEGVKARLSALEFDTDYHAPPENFASLTAAANREAMATVQKAGPAVAFAVGDKAFHLKFGYGRVVNVDKNKVTVEFDKAGRKAVLNTFLSRP